MKPPPVEGAGETPEDKRPAPGDAVTFAEQLSTLPPPPPRKVSKKPAPPDPAAAPGVATGVTPETEPTAPAPGETPPAAPAVPDPTAATVPPEAAATPAGKTMPPPATPPPTQPGAPATAGAPAAAGRARRSSPCGAGPEDHPAHAHLRDSRCGSQRSKRSALRAHRGASRPPPDAPAVSKRRTPRKPSSSSGCRPSRRWRAPRARSTSTGRCARGPLNATPLDDRDVRASWCCVRQRSVLSRPRGRRERAGARSRVRHPSRRA